MAFENALWHRFSDKFYPDPASDCWLWTGATKPGGYGNFWDGEKVTGAHQFSYRVFNGAIPKGLQIDHLCHVRCCVNPDHLEAVTPRVNALRSNSFAAKNARKTHCPNGHELSEENCVGHWLRKGQRLCRICYNARKRTENRARYAAERAAL